MVFCPDCAANKISYWDSSEASNEKFTDLIADVKENMYGWFPLSKEELPLELPYVESYEPLESGESPLAAMTEWTKTVCSHCGGLATRETDTMPNWAGSCWYFLQFALDQDKRGLDKWPEALQKDAMTWTPVDWYIGGAEHAVLHLLYARFWMHALNDMGLVNFREPFLRLRNVGMVQAEDGRKMSKSLGNVVNPDDVIAEFGADTLRTYVMFMAPFNQEIAWSTKTLRGISRFLARVWRIYTESAKITKEGESYDTGVLSELQSLINKNTASMANVKLNTPIAGCMEFLNSWEKSTSGIPMKFAKQYLQLLAPYAPYMTEELWRTVCEEKESIHNSQWPTPDESLTQEKNIIIPVQVNGKVREQIELSADQLSEEVVKEKALASERVTKWIEGKEYRMIYVPGKILNIVLL
jgi:leucyl-tRNA synthetase